MRKSLLAVACAAFSLPAVAESAETEETLVTGLRERLYNTGALKDVIQQTELISASDIDKSNANNLSSALESSPGVRVNNECSMCGVKRVMLNGLRGEHTTILVDGIPTYTMMSGFYGIDGATMSGIERIEVARGAGASMIAPEAIGGTINLVSKFAEENSAEFDLSISEDGCTKAEVYAGLLTNDEATRISAALQYDYLDIFDGDDNGVGENPELENTSGTLLLSQDFGESDNLRVRLNLAKSEIFGGPTGTNIDEVIAEFESDPDWESPSLFEDDDVRNQFIGRGWETTEWIESQRTEFYANWLHEFNEDLNLSLTGSYNKHEQDSFYEGFIYDAENPMTYFDARANWTLSEAHLLTFGVDNRSEELRSETNSDSDLYVSDNFDYDTFGIYLQDTWNASDSLEISTALRIDQVTADFVDPQKPGTEIDETIFSPRIDVRYMHSDTWTSRFSGGRGYRAPLSFFESDHGILDGDVGFDIQVDELERSVSFNYALSYTGDRLTATSSVAHTTIENLATLDESESGVPILDQADEDAKSLVADVALTYSFTDDLALSATWENIYYEDEFKQAFGVVPIEERIQLAVDWSAYGWDIYSAATWVGSRDLSEYGTPENPTFDANGEFAKSTKAEAFWTLDFRAEKEIKDGFSLYGGADNLFGYNQAEDMESPLFYEDGEFDVAHIYGPLRGREIYLGVKFKL